MGFNTLHYFKVAPGAHADGYFYEYLWRCPDKAVLSWYRYSPVSFCVPVMPCVCCASYIAENHFSPFRKARADHDVFSHMILVASVLLI
jgi:hypothetical protein